MSTDGVENVQFLVENYFPGAPKELGKRFWTICEISVLTTGRVLLQQIVNAGCPSSLCEFGEQSEIEGSMGQGPHPGWG